jgi:hypothetical protein
MRRIRLSTVFGVALSCVLGNLSVVLAQTAQTPSHDVSDLIRQQGTPTVYEYCSSVTPQSGPGGQRVYYYSGVFGGPYTALSGADKAFVQFLEQKYSFKSGGNNARDAVCQNNETEAQARGNEQSSLNSTRQHNQAVETGWTYSVAGSAGAATGAPASASSASAPQSNDPRLAQLSQQDRKFVLDEIPGSKTYCANNMVLPLIFDCDCFAQMVFNYRVTHPNLGPRPSHETADLVAGTPAPPEAFSNIIPKLDCSKCISEERITKWVTDSIRKSVSGYSEPQVKAITACTARTLINDLQAKPEMGDIGRARYGAALVACTKSGGAAASATSPAQAAQPNEGPAAAVSQRYGYCYAQAPSGWYFSAPLSAAGAGGGDIAYYFHHFLIAKFGVQQEVGCQITFVWHSLADVQTYLQRAEDAQRSYGKNVIETGWTYSGAGPAGAAASAPSQPPAMTASTHNAASQSAPQLAPAALPAASGQQGAANTPAPAAGVQAAPAPGTSVEVAMIDAVDSSRDPAGKQYRATATKAVNASNNVTIPQGAAATVTLVRNGASWVAQLSSLMINGQPVTVASNSAALTSTAQNTASTVSNTIGGIFGRKPNVPSAAQTVATGDWVILPPGSRLSFVLAAAPTGL